MCCREGDVRQKVLTVSRKSERLVNLVIALLATKRSLTKSEIFRTIEGYEGSDESMERMFERDKDELRSIGIEIEVSVLDPLFEDEQGYRIRPENFSMDANGFTPLEITYMSLAAQLWKDATLDDLTQRVLRKLSAVSSQIDIAELPALAPIAQNVHPLLTEVIEGLISHQAISFLYIDSELAPHQRRVSVHSYFSKKGLWYFTGLDLDKNDIRTFRCDRIRGEVEILPKIKVDEHLEVSISKDSEEGELEKYLAIVKVRKGRGSQIRNLSSTMSFQDDHDLLEIEYSFEDEFLSLVLWHLDDVEVISPESLRRRVHNELLDLVKKHE